MAFEVQGEIEGLDLLLFNLQSLRASKSRQVSRRALASASSVPLKAAKRQVTKETGQLKKSLGKKAPKTYQSGVIVVVIGPREGFKDPDTGRNPVKYAHLVELGTVRARAKPFLRPALMSTKDEAIRVYQRKAWEGFEREVAKMRT